MHLVGRCLHSPMKKRTMTFVNLKVAHFISEQDGTRTKFENIAEVSPNYFHAFERRISMNL